MKYIAYGSNMVKEHMSRLCPDAEFIGIGYLPNHRLEFYSHATVEPDKSCAKGVPVAVWEISANDEQNLDYYEGYPGYYNRKTVTVNMTDGSQITGMVYIMRPCTCGTPYMAYYEAICDAYEQLGFSSEIDTVLLPALRKARRRG